MQASNNRVTDLLNDVQDLNNISSNLNRSIRAMFGPFEALHFKMPIGAMLPDRFVFFCEDLSAISIEELMTILPHVCDAVNLNSFQTYYKNLTELVSQSHAKLISLVESGAPPSVAFTYLSDEHVIKLYAMFNSLRVYETSYTLPTHLKGMLYG